MSLNDENRRLKRRRFVKMVGTSTAGMIAGQSLLAQESTGKKTLRIGLIGTGGRGTAAVMDALSIDENLQLTALGDIFPNKLTNSLSHITKKYPDRCDVPAERQFIGFDAYQKVIESGVDIVILATTPAFRPQHMKAAVSAGKHIFAEKPLAVDIAGMKSVMDSARKAKSAGISVMTGLVWRYTPSLMELHKRIANGDIGHVTHASSTYCGASRPNPLPPEKYRPKDMSHMEWALHYWQNYHELGGDGILEFMVHGIDKLSWAFGDQIPVSCYANGGNNTPIEGSNNWDHFSLFFEYPDGRRASFLGRQIPRTYTPSGDYISGTKGHASVDSHCLAIKQNTKTIWNSQIGELGFANEQRIFIDHIRRAKTYNDIIGKMEVSHLMALMGRAAAYTGSLVTHQALMNSQEKLIETEDLNFTHKFTPRPTAIPGVTKFL